MVTPCRQLTIFSPAIILSAVVRRAMLIMSPAQDADLAIAQRAERDAPDSQPQPGAPGFRQLLGLGPGGAEILEALWQSFEQHWYRQWLHLESQKQIGSTASERWVLAAPQVTILPRIHSYEV